MADGEQTGFPQVSAPASAAVQVPEEEEENNEDTESGNSDDDEDMDDINHTALPKEVVRPNTPTVRPQTADIWKHVSCIAKHDVPDRAMKTECTHVCVYRLDDEDGEKRYCNKRSYVYGRRRQRRWHLVRQRVAAARKAAQIRIGAQ